MAWQSSRVFCCTVSWVVVIIIFPSIQHINRLLATTGIGQINHVRAASLEFLQRLLNTPSPSGHEVRGQRVWLDYAKRFADETFNDAYGNTVAILNKGGSPRLMLAGHADEIAMAEI